MKAVIFTLGCKVNSCESAALATGLKELGYEVTDKLSYADLYVLNTCAVTKEAEKKSRQAVARIRAFNKNARIIVAGCASQHNPESFLKKEGVYLVTGAINKEKIISLINSKGVILDSSNEYYERFMPTYDSRSRAFIKVEDGCNNFCSYCLIPYLRGRCRSRSIGSIQKEIESLNPKEAVITGINLSCYNYDGNDLADLMTALKHFNIRLRLGSLEENIISEKLLNSLSSLKKFAPHFHLSLQSGSDKVLRDMNRHYNRAEFIDSVARVRERFPDAAITTDIIVGYPTENDDDFQKTIELCETVGFADIHCFVFSPREGTAAFNLKQLPASVTDPRLERLLDIKAKAKSAFITRFFGRQLTVLPEEYKDGYTVGYSDNYIRCYLKGRYEEEFISVTVQECFKDGALCVPVN